jgi:orotidine-5'-phosphate decarboxylase
MAELVLALDVPDRDTALDMVRPLRGRLTWVKVGLELFCTAGPVLVRELREMGFKVFVDLKFLDIPNTVRGAVRSAVTAGADMLTLHLLGGEDMARAALAGRDEALQEGQEPPIILGVTLLTSLGEKDLVWNTTPETAEPLPDMVVRLAGLAKAWGLSGVVCSGQEAERIRREHGPDLTLLTPGIRMTDAGDDQTRAVTPAMAVAAGSDYLVVGRPITKAADPIAALGRFLEEL